MRYRLIVLTLFAMVPVMSVLAAPAPAPSAILDIGPPPKGETLEQHCKREIGYMDFPHGMLNEVWGIPEVRKLPSVTRFKDARPWLAKNLRIAEEDGGHRLRLTFRDGGRTEQVVILNTLLRVNLRAKQDRIKYFEECIGSCESNILQLEKRIKSCQNPQEAASYRKGINELRSIRIPALRADIAHVKQFVVIKWAK